MVNGSKGAVGFWGRRYGKAAIARCANWLRFVGKLHSHAYRMVKQLMNPAPDVEMAVLCGRMVQADQAGTTTMVGFNYRRAPAIQLAYPLIRDGRLGTIFQVRGQYLQDWAIDPAVPLTWRFQQSVAGSGSVRDLLTHVIDLTHFLVGEFEKVSAFQQTFGAQRPLLGKLTGEGLGHGGQGSDGALGSVAVDDVTAVVAGLSKGVVGAFEATRFATGYKNGLRLEIHGDRGALRFDLEHLNELEYYR